MHHSTSPNRWRLISSFQHPTVADLDSSVLPEGFWKSLCGSLRPFGFSRMFMHHKWPGSTLCKPPTSCLNRPGMAWSVRRTNRIGLAYVARSPHSLRSLRPSVLSFIDRHSISRPCFYVPCTTSPSCNRTHNYSHSNCVLYHCRLTLYMLELLEWSTYEVSPSPRHCLCTKLLQRLCSLHSRR